MRILQVNKFFHLKGGSEAYLFSLIDQLLQRGHSVAEFAMKDPQNRESKWSKYFVEHINYDTSSPIKKINYAFKIIYSYEAKKKISRLLDAYKPDIAHLHIFQHQLSPSILHEIKKREMPIVYTSHDLKSVCPNYKMLTHGQVCERCKGHKYYNCLRFMCTKGSFTKSLVNTMEMYHHYLLGYYDLIDLLITPSNFYREKLVEFRFPENKVIHVPNFIDESQYVPKYAHGDYFIYFGRLSEEKGIFTLVEAMRRVMKAKLIIIGSGPLEDIIQKKIDLLKLKNVEMVGFQSGNELKNLIQNCMFSILPSEWYENGPVSLLETFAYGKPVIGADIGGIPEYITPGEDGSIFESGNSVDLSEKISNMLQNSRKIIEMGKNARVKIERFYSKNVHVDKIIDLYKELL